MKRSLEAVAEIWKTIKRSGQPGATYFALMSLGLLMITITGHLGGILSGVESP